MFKGIADIVIKFRMVFSYFKNNHLPLQPVFIKQIQQWQ